MKRLTCAAFVLLVLAAMIGPWQRTGDQLQPPRPTARTLTPALSQRERGKKALTPALSQRERGKLPSRRHWPVVPVSLRFEAPPVPGVEADGSRASRPADPRFQLPTEQVRPPSTAPPGTHWLRQPAGGRFELRPLPLGEGQGAGGSVIFDSSLLPHSALRTPHSKDPHPGPLPEGEGAGPLGISEDGPTLIQPQGVRGEPFIVTSPDKAEEPYHSGHQSIERLPATTTPAPQSISSAGRELERLPALGHAGQDETESTRQPVSGAILSGQNQAGQPVGSPAAVAPVFPPADSPTTGTSLPAESSAREPVVPAVRPLFGAPPSPADAAPAPVAPHPGPHPEGEGGWTQTGEGRHAVVRQAQLLTHQADCLARKGAYYSARAKYIQALRLIAQAHDSVGGGMQHSRKLSQAFQALKEADDFLPKGSRLEADLDISGTILAHRSGVLKDAQHSQLTPLDALQRYYKYAQSQLVEACGNEPAASAALYGLGKLHMALGSEASDIGNLHAPKAMGMHQAALLVDKRNYRAANELGYLLARYGQLRDAKQVLMQSVTAQPMPEAWHNLAIVHHQLGEHDLAERARLEAELARQQRLENITNAVPSSHPMVKWVDPQTFANSSQPPPSQPKARPQDDQAKPGTAWQGWPWETSQR